MTSCRACGDALIFGITEKGRRIPLNPEPGPHGNIRVVGHDDLGRPLVQVLHDGDVIPGSDPLYTSHFKDCPAAQRFRKRDRRRA